MDNLHYLAMNVQTLDQKLNHLNLELEEISDEEIALTKRRGEVVEKINAINLVKTMFPTEEDEDDDDFIASVVAHIDEARSATIPERVIQVLSAHTGVGLTSGQIGDIILKEGFPNPSATFKISVSTACSRLVEKKKLKFTVGSDGRKLYAQPDNEVIFS